MNMKNILLLIPLVAFFFTGCSLLHLKEDLNNQKKLIEINVEIDVKSPVNAPIIIVLLDVEESKYDIINYAIIKEDNKVRFIAKPSNYQLFAFEDVNGDEKFTSNERGRRSQIIDMNEAGSKKSIKLKINQFLSKYELNSLEEIKNGATNNISNSRAYLGSVVSLDSDYFSKKNIIKGLWEPLKFTKEVPFGIFLLDEYDPKKEVVLFIHGIAGSPKSFSYLIENLDKSSYQVMIAYYPTGVSANMASEYFAGVISELKIKFKYKKITIVSHSLGGLISRSIVNKLALNHRGIVKNFISISTPWGGDIGAAAGVKHSPVVIPVWRDLAPKSKFLEEIFKAPLADTKFYLVFGIKGKGSDGVVSIASQLRLEAQNDSTLIRGFNETHMSILESKDVSNLINSILKGSK